MPERKFSNVSKNFMEAAKALNISRINKLNIFATTIYLLIQYVMFAGNVIMGVAEWWYFIGFIIVSAPIYIVYWIRYFRNSSDNKLKYFLSVGFIISYYYIMLLGTSIFRFAFIFPPLCFMIMYHSAGFILGISIAATAMNIFNLVYVTVITGHNDLENTSRFAIQIMVIIFATLGAYYAARVYSKSYNMTLEQNAELEQMSLQTIETIANTIDAKDAYTQGHSRRVADYSCIIAQNLGFDEDEIEHIRFIALLHDVGKIAVPDTVLNKPGRLTDEEYELMKIHTTAGAEILQTIKSIPDIDLGARYHHERFDGKGYPEGLKGKKIPVIARIICLADAYDAMTSTRVYRTHLSMEVVMEEIKKGRGSQFDPECVDAFMPYITEELNKKGSNTKTIKASSDVKTTRKLIGIVSGKDEAGSMDELTGAYSRAYGEKILNDVLSKHGGAIILINIVGLKEINMEHGYRVGDHYLKLVADTLRGSNEKPIIVRFKGNEFVAFLPDITDREVVEEWMDDFLERMAKKEERDPMVEKSNGVSCAIDVNVKPSHKTMVMHIRELDKVMYMLKRMGDNEYAFYDGVNKEGEEYIRKSDMHDLIAILKGDGKIGKVGVMGSNDFLHTISDLKTAHKGDFGLLLFTTKPVAGDDMPLNTRSHVVSVLEKAITMVMGDSNHMASYSSLQRVVIICGDANDYEKWQSNINLVEKSILSNFYKIYDKYDVEVICKYCTVFKNGDTRGYGAVK